MGGGGVIHFVTRYDSWGGLSIRDVTGGTTVSDTGRGGSIFFRVTSFMNVPLLRKSDEIFVIGVHVSKLTVDQHQDLIFASLKQTNSIVFTSLVKFFSTKLGIRKLTPQNPETFKIKNFSKIFFIPISVTL